MMGENTDGQNTFITYHYSFLKHTNSVFDAKHKVVSKFEMF